MTDVPYKKHNNNNIWIASVQLVSVGLAQARPNNYYSSRRCFLCVCVCLFITVRRLELDFAKATLFQSYGNIIFYLFNWGEPKRAPHC